MDKVMKILLAVAFLVFMVCGCNVMTSPTASLAKGQIVEHGIFDDAIVISQVVSTNEVHAYSRSDDGFMYGLRIAIQPLTDDYVTGQRIRLGRYEYLGPYTYVTIKDGKGNDGQTNTIRLFRERKD